MEPRLTDNLRAVLFLIILFSTGSSENDLDLNFCGIWRHGNSSLSLTVNLSTGCTGISISANESSLSIDGQITAQCRVSDVIHLKQFGLDSDEKESTVCLYWEPLLDQLILQVGRRTNFMLCRPASVQGPCCTDLSLGPIQTKAHYGIFHALVNNDVITDTTRTTYEFNAGYSDCKALCDQASQRSPEHDTIEDTGMKLQDAEIVEHFCARSFEVEMKEDFRGYNLTSPTTQGVSESNITVYIPPALKQAANKTNKVRCTFFKNIFLFQEGHTDGRILDNVVKIDMENEVITHLPEPIKIGFTHDVMPKTHSRKCVSWDPRKDPWQVSWVVDGCETRQQGTQHTECLCNHLAYFSVLVRPEPRPVCHLLALTAITSLGCAVSVISCFILIIFLCRKSKQPEQSIPSIQSIHLGLAVSSVILNLPFFFTGVLANMGGESVCALVGAGLHYAMLSSFFWMGTEVFHTFWLSYTALPTPKPFVWNLVGFIFPAVPVFILVRVGDIYGVKAVLPCDDASSPYLMCWMKDTHKALLAHYFTNTTVLVIHVTSSILMLFMLYRRNRTRDDWRQNRVAFLSIWGLSILFGVTFSLLDFGPFSEFVVILSCIFISLQGLFLTLRFYVLDRMRKQPGGSAPGSSSM